MSYPWKDMPLRKTVGSPYTEFPAVLQTAMTPLVELQRIARDPGYQYVSCESHGPGYQVQWYTRDSKRVKRLAKAVKEDSIDNTQRFAENDCDGDQMLDGTHGGRVVCEAV